MTSHEACAILELTPYSRCVNGIAPTDTLYAYIWKDWPDSGLPMIYGLLTVSETQMRLIIVNNYRPVGKQTHCQYYPLDVADGVAEMMTQMTA